PGPARRGSQPLEVTVVPSGNRTVADVIFQYAPAGTDKWITIAHDDTAPYRQSFDTTGLADGLYDLRTQAVDSTGATGTSSVLEDRIVNQEAASASVDTDPAGRTLLHGTASFAGTVTSNEAIDHVAFQRSPAGARAWTTFSTSTQRPYSASLDTTGLADGLYDFRTVVTDAVGNTIFAPTLSGLRIDNTPPSAKLNAP